MSEFLKQLPRPEVHPLLPWLSEDKIRDLLASHNGLALYRESLTAYVKRVERATDDPLYSSLLKT